MRTSPTRVVSITTGTILRTIAILVAIALLWIIRDIILLVFVSVLLAGVIYPFARWAAKYHIPKSVSVIFFYIVMIGALTFAFSVLIPVMLEEAKMLVNTYGSSVTWAKDAIVWFKSISDQAGLVQDLRASVGTYSDQISSAFGGAFATITDIFGGLASVIVVFVLSLYLIVEEEAAKSLFRNVVPEEYQEFASGMVWQVVDRLGAWFRGQLVLGLIIGVAYFIVLSIIGVPYALLLAILGGLLEFIPYLGPIVTAIPVLFLALSISPARALVALVAVITIQQLENNLIVPKVMQKAVGLNPVVSIVAFMIGAKIFGVVGALFAIPVTTAGSVILMEFLRFRREGA